MKPDLKAINSSSHIVADGAWGTELQKRGLAPGSSPELWNADHPELVADVARAYAAAGAQIILTNTFGCNRFILQRHGLAGRVAELNSLGARITHETAGTQALVCGSMGPTGVLLAAGEVTEERIYDSYLEQARALADTGVVDAILIETMSDVAEMNLAAEAARSVSRLPLVLSMTFDSGRDRSRTMMGITPEQAVAAMEEAGAWMIGANCGLGPDSYVPVCARMRAVTSKPIWVKANAGIPRVTPDGIEYPQDPRTFAEHCVRLLDAGCNVIGGCCGTSPEYIRELARVLV
jgi:methionine synthase I (cobalamin-dependent)